MYHYTPEAISYNVYCVAYSGLPRDHHAIFVELVADGAGQIFQVIGNIQSGMAYETKPAKKPDESNTYQSSELIGTVTTANHARIDSECETIPPPPKQFIGPRRIDL